MEYIRCGKGHFYNPDQHSSCPTCAKEQQSGVMDFSKTMPIGNASNGTTYLYDVGATQPLNYQNTANDGITGTEFFVRGQEEEQRFGNGMDPVSQTVPIGSGTEKVGRKNGTVIGEIGATQPIYPVYMNSDPVVGWLVCVEGFSRGTDYRIHSGYNYIGRARNMDICIQGDETITAERAAEIAYDDQNKKFCFNKCNGRNLVRINGDMVMVPVELKPYDKLTIGMTTLLFVPFCGEKFDWNGK